MKNRILALTLVVALLAVAVAGATMAYFTDTDQAVNVATVGNVSIQQIELQRAEGVAHNATAKEGDLVPFVQGQTLAPAYHTSDDAYTAEATDLFFWGPYVYTGTAGNGLWNDQKLVGAMDKFVFVENTGDSACYFRTWIAFECPEGMEYSEGFDKEFMMNTNGSAVYDWSDSSYVEIDGVRYLVVCATYQRALPSGATSHPSLLQVVMTHNATNEDAAKIGSTYEILVFSQAVQADNFPNAETALEKAFGTEHPWTSLNKEDVSAEDLTDALQNTNDTTVILNLTEDATYDVSSWNTFAMGGENTELIVINGNGHTLTFNLRDSDWSHVTTNGAKLVLNDVNIKSAGYNSGHWKRNGVAFACEVEMNNVTTCPIILENDAQLNYVTIEGGADIYGLWISAADINVSANGLTINSGRGIKIADEDVKPVAKTTLTVKNAEFNTAKKAAILVTSTAGADITLENVDIYGVAADPFNAVWVDEDRASYDELVTVTGGTKVIEGKFEIANVDDKADLQNALKDAVADGETEVYINAQGQSIDMNKGLSGATVPAGTTVTIANANVNAKSYGNGVNGTVVFENCTFENPNGAYSIHFDSGSGHVVFNNCTLSGWCSFGSAIKSVEMNNCTIKGNGIYAMVRFYQPTVMNNCTIDCSNTRIGDVYVDGVSAVSGAVVELNDCTITYADLEVSENCKIVADGTVLAHANTDYVLKNVDNR